MCSLSIWSTPKSLLSWLFPPPLNSIVVDDAKAAVLIRGVFGLGVAIVWSPIFTRLWERCYNVLRVRWTLDAKSARLGLLDPSTNQKPIQEVSSNENPYNPRYIWKYVCIASRCRSIRLGWNSYMAGKYSSIPSTDRNWYENKQVRRAASP